jgi:hypothetical protein
MSIAWTGMKSTCAAILTVIGGIISKHQIAIILESEIRIFADSGDCGQAFRLIADSDSDRSRTAFR